MRLRPIRGARAPQWILLTVLLALAGPPAARAQGVHVALMPAQQTVVPGGELDLEIDVTQAGASFNGFDAVIAYDPAALSFVQASPLALQQGCLMTGGCSAACGNTFHAFAPAADSMAITDILLCNLISLTGPGQIYKLHFIASATPQVTHVRFRTCRFYNAGLFVTPVVTADAAVGIGVALDAGDPRPSVSGLHLRAEPNPAHGPVALAVETDASGEQSLEVLDISGRLVRRLSSGWQERGVRRVWWDGTDAAGARVPAGIYRVTLRLRNRSAETRVALLK